MEIKRVADAYQAMAYEPSTAKIKKSAPAKPAEMKKEQVELSEKSQNLQKGSRQGRPGNTNSNGGKNNGADQKQRLPYRYAP
jgi:hypothetical protein